jgi:hypothetical protein
VADAIDAQPAAHHGAYAAPTARIEDLAARRQTRLGTTSMVIAVGIGFLQIAALVATMVAFRIDPGHPRVATDSPLMVGAFFTILGGVGVQAVGLLLGLAGLLRSQRQRTHAWIGIACNALPVLALASLLAAGAWLK